MLYIAYFQSIMEYLEWSLSWQPDLTKTKINWIEQRWSDFKDFKMEFIRAFNILENFVIILVASQQGSTELADCMRDFRDINRNLVQLKGQCDSNISSLTGLAGIVNSRLQLNDTKQSLEEAKRSFREARSLRTLSWLATIFIPLSFVSGILSMHDLYVPGVGRFSIYLSIAVPLVILVTAIIFVEGKGYDQAGVWLWKNILRNLARKTEHPCLGESPSEQRLQLPESNRTV